MRALRPAEKHAHAERPDDEYCRISVELRPTRSELIRAGIARAKAWGAPLGGRHPGAHQLTKAEIQRGARASALKKMQKANEPYRQWIPGMTRKRLANWSCERIARWLRRFGVRTANGVPITRRHVDRILAREMELKFGAVLIA